MKDPSNTDVWKKMMTNLSAILKPYGFAKSGRCFTDGNAKDIIRQVSIEKFRWNFPGHQQFSLLLSLYLATGPEGEFTFKGHTAHYSLVFRKNIGYFQGNEDLLFLLPNTLSDQAFFTEFHRLITDTLLPVLERCTSRDAAIDFLEQETQKIGPYFFSLSLAIALARLGRMQESEKYFRQCPGDAVVIANLAERYGIYLKN